MIATLASAQFVAGALTGRPTDPDFYRSLDQAPFAPPSWAFAPAWAIAKTGSSISAVTVWERRDMRGRKAYLTLETLGAALYVTFPYVYFRKKSPVLAAVWTCATAGVIAAQGSLLARSDRRAALGLLPEAAWLALATPAAIYQAARNPGPVIRS